MSEIKALDELRKLASNRRQDLEKPYVAQNEYKEIEEALNEIEREIDSRYMLLPVDMGDVPIHVGDICEMSEVQFKVRQLDTDGYCWWVVDETGEFYIAELCHHVKPRTLTDILADLFERKMSVTDAEHEISELLGGDV